MEANGRVGREQPMHRVLSGQAGRRGLAKRARVGGSLTISRLPATDGPQTAQSRELKNQGQTAHKALNLLAKLPIFGVKTTPLAIVLIGPLPGGTRSLLASPKSTTS